MTKIITINYKKIQCRRLKKGEKLALGDWNETMVRKILAESVGSYNTSGGPFYRPVKSQAKPKYGKVRAWIEIDAFNPNMCPGDGHWKMKMDKPLAGNWVEGFFTPIK